MKTKNLKIFMALTLVFSTLITSNVFAATKNLSVDRVRQSKTNWCWAACGEMMGSYLYSSSTRDQYDIYEEIKGSRTTNYTANLNEVRNAIEYGAHDKVNISYSTSKWAFSKFKTSIDNYEPVVIRMGWSNGGGHVVVVKGYNDSNSSVNIVDPASTTISYYKVSDLINGTTIQSGTGTYTHTFYVN